MITHKWTRTDADSVRTTSDVDDDFAVYVSDESFGIESTIDASAISDNTYYVLRHRVRREHNLAQPLDIYDQEIRYYRDTSNPSEMVERYWTRSFGSTSWNLLNVDVTPTGGGGGTIFLETKIVSFKETVVTDANFDDIPGTTKTEFEFGEEGQTPIWGGIGASGGILGVNGGFDIRALAIADTAVSKIRFNSMNDMVTLSGTIVTLPSQSAIFQSPWVPSGDIEWSIAVGGITSVSGGTTSRDVYQVFEGTESPSSSVEIEAIWKGRYELGDSERIGQEVVGTSYIYFNATAPSPEGSTLEAREKTETVESYTEFSHLPGSTCYSICEVGLNYQSHLSEAPVSSLGYGWQEVSHNRIEEDLVRNQVVFHRQGGGKMRWDEDGGGYTPSARNLYTICEKDTTTAVNSAPNSRTTRFTLTFKSQTKWEFNDSGRLIRITDRNNNSSDYIYHSTTGHLDRIEVDGGRNTYFTRRPDGQPIEIRDGDPVDGRLTQIDYYEEGDPGPLGRLRSITNPELEMTEFVYNGQDKLSQVVDPRGNVMMQFSYDETGRKIAEFIYGEVVRFYDYTFFGFNMREEDLTDFNALESINPNADVGSGLYTSVSYDDRQRVSGYTVGRWYYEEYSDYVYDENLDEYVEEFYYDIVTEDEAFTSFEYTDEENPFLKTKQTDPDLVSTTWKYDDFGNVIEETDKEGNLYVYTYADTLDSPLNPKHRNLLRRIQRPEVTVNGVVTAYEPTELIYDSLGNLSEIIDVTDSDSFKTEMTYTSDGLVETFKDRRGYTTNFVYTGSPFVKNQSRNLQRIEVPKGDGPSAGVRTTQFTYDAYDNLKTATDDLGNTMEYFYDLLDRRTGMEDGNDELTSFEYEDGLLKKIFLPPNTASSGVQRTTTLSHDTQGRVDGIQREIGGSSQISRVEYFFNGRSQIQSMVRRQGTEESRYLFLYDHRGRRTQTIDPLGELSRIVHPDFCKNTETHSARGVSKLFRNNDRCLLEDIFSIGEFGELELDRKFRYDELGRLVWSAYDCRVYGKASYGSDTYSQTQTYVYDKRNRLIQMIYSDGKSISWSYDADSNLTRMVDPEGKVTEYSYYRDNLLHKVTIKRGDPETVVGEFVYTYDAAGRLDEIEYPSSTGITAIFRDAADTPGSGFDANGNIRFLRYEKSGVTDPLRSFEWTYDDSNNRQSQLEVTPTKAILWEYSVDWLDRLVAVKRAEAVDVASLPASPLGATHLQREYVWDESDNRTFFDDHVAGVTYHYTYKSIDDNGTTRYSDQLEEILIYATAAGHRTVGDFVSFETLTTDEDGNLTKRTIAATGEEISYEFSEFDRLKRVESDLGGNVTRLQDARYGVDGLRNRKLDKGGNSSEEYGVGITTAASAPGSASSNAPSISYVAGHLLLGAEVNGSFVFHLSDALGTTRDVIDDQGSVIRSFEFSEYGDLISSSGSGTVSPKTWIGGLSVNDDTADSGMFNMGHRSYQGNPLGRFISRDPIGHAGNLNLYAYPTNPVNAVDPSGLDCWIVDNNGNESFYDENQFGDFLRRWQQGGIDRVVIGGHASFQAIYPEIVSSSNYEINYNYLFSTRGQIEIGYTDQITVRQNSSNPGSRLGGAPPIYEQTRSKRKFFPVERLVGKAKHVELRGCRTGTTGRGKCLAKDLSQALPGTQVTGDLTYCGGPLERDGGPGMSGYWEALRTGNLQDFDLYGAFNQPITFLNGKEI